MGMTRGFRCRSGSIAILSVLFAIVQIVLTGEVASGKEGRIDGYILQYSANAQEVHANRNAAVLQKKGYEAFVEIREIAGKGTLHCVYLRGFKRRAEAEKAAAALGMSRPYLIRSDSGLARAEGMSPERPLRKSRTDLREGKIMAGRRWYPRSYPTSPVETRRSREPVTESPSFPQALPPLMRSLDRQQPPAALYPPQPLTVRDTPGIPRSGSVVGEATSPAKDRDVYLVSVAYEVMYADMSWRFVNANYASAGFLHGPSLGTGWGPWSLRFSFLTSDTWNGEARDVTSAGLGYLRKEILQRRDYDVVLGRELIPGRGAVALDGLVGFTFTDLPEVKSRYFLDDGTFFGLDGSMRIWGPMAGLKLTIPLGSPRTSPFKLNLSGLAMYLTAEGRHDQSLSPAGVALNSVAEGKAFNASGWGGRIDANLDWHLFRGLHAVVGIRVQSASLRDNGIDSSTVRASNGLFGAYGSVRYGW